MPENIYERQEQLLLSPPTHVAIIGVGGVGCHVGLLLSEVGVKNIILVDDDDIEASNLNRTHFKYTQIGMKKVTALAELIYERRPECNVEIYPTKYEDLDDDTKRRIRHHLYTVVDCRDATSILENNWSMPITGGYDGLKGTIHIKPDYSSIFGSDANVRYRITPSYIVPPILIAISIVNYLCIEKDRKKWANEKILEFDCSKMLDMFKKVT